MSNLPGFERSESHLTDKMLRGAELLIGVKFPESFRQVALLFDGSSGDADFPVPGTRRGAGSIGLWLSFLPWAPNSVWSWLSFWREHDLPRAVVPFGEDGGGNLICLDYRFSTTPSVSIWYHELNGPDVIYPVADDFQQWLSSVAACGDGV
jgi:hypothetical protein